MSFSNYRSFYQRIHTYNQIQAILQWDSEVMMPPLARSERAKQLSELSSLIHGLFTGDEFSKALDAARIEVENMDNGDPLKNVRRKELKIIQKKKERESKLPVEFVTKLSEKTNLAQGVWEEAKKKKDFSLFSGILSELVGMAKQKADYFGYQKERYDALLDEYEEGETASHLDELFRELKSSLVPLVERGKSYPNPFSQGIESSKQESFCKTLPPALGLSYDLSRLDKSAHPFSTSLGSKDKRITTRYMETDPLSAVFGVMHEVGHSLYEAGLSEIPDSPHPISEYLSLGVHESQSRLWENQVGRSREFWNYYYPIALKHWELTSSELPFEPFIKAVKSVEKSKIRVEADQLTYNLHIILRFELERDLISGKLSVSELEDSWNAKMKEMFGLNIDNPSEGVLQDVHWCMAAFGYFPTYNLGNIYSAQLFHAFQKSHPDFLKNLSESGDTSPLLKWLKTNVHHKGSLLSVEELLVESTGEKANSHYLIDHLTSLVDEK